MLVFSPSLHVCWSVKSAAVGGSGGGGGGLGGGPQPRFILRSLRFLCLGFVFHQGEMRRALSE